MARYSELQKREIGERITIIRQLLNLDQNEFGHIIVPNASASNVSRWERGLNVPNADRIKSIAEVGHVSVTFLLSGTGMTINDIQNFLKKISHKSNLTEEEIRKLKELSIENKIELIFKNSIFNESHKIFKDDFFNNLTPEESVLANQEAVLFNRVLDSELPKDFLKDFTVYLAGITNLIAGNFSKADFSEYQDAFNDSINKNFK